MSRMKCRFLRLVLGLIAVVSACALPRTADATCQQTALLQPPWLRSVGFKPRDVALGDFNVDGIVDVAITCPDPLTGVGYNNSIVVMRGRGSAGVGDGTFTSGTSYPVGTRPWMLVGGDFNGDGKADLAVTNWASNNVSILLGRGDGTFGVASNFPAGSNPYGIVAEDFNHDGILDLAVSNNGSASVSVLIGQGSGGVGNGTFAPPVAYPIANLSTGIAAADLDGDGDIDLVATTNYAGKVAVLLGKADGTFAPAQAYAAGLEPFAVIIQDFNGDGILDLAVGNAQSGGVAILRGVGDGSFGPPSIQAAGINVASLTTGDFNQDGITDIVFACNTANNVQILLGQGSGGVGNGTFVLQGAYSGVGTPLSVVSKDLNADDVPDVVVAAYGSGSIATMLGGCGATLTDSPQLISVRDVPNDQGGRVFLRWLRSSFDVPGSGSVTGYRVWRRVPPGAIAAHPGAVPLATLGRAAVSVDYWEAIASLPAEGMTGYGYTAATTQDSMRDSNPYTAFFVTALTASAAVFYQSNVDSGYSVDDLAPPAPIPFAATYGGSSTSLHWGASRAPDFLEFRLYRGGAGFVPGPSSLLLTTRDTAYVDPDGGSYEYKLASVDLHGNVSRCALVSPALPVAALVSSVVLVSGPDRIDVTWYAATDPSLPATVYRRTGSGAWVSLARVHGDATGYVRYEDRDVAAGVRYEYRLGVLEDGAEVFGGEVWGTTKVARFALQGARPNPAVAGRLRVQFVMPTGEPARLELFDVSGRCVRRQDVTGLGAGEHAVDLSPGSRVPAGVYVIRFSQGNRTATARAVVLD